MLKILSLNNTGVVGFKTSFGVEFRVEPLMTISVTRDTYCHLIIPLLKSPLYAVLLSWGIKIVVGVYSFISEYTFQ